MTKPRVHRNSDPEPVGDDTEDVRYYRGNSQPRVQASVILDAYVAMLLAGKGEEFRAKLDEHDFELRVPAGFVNALKGQIVKHEVHRMSPLAAAVAKSDHPKCNGPWIPRGLVATTSEVASNRKDDSRSEGDA